jgi:hypothetical protein
LFEDNRTLREENKRLTEELKKVTKERDMYLRDAMQFAICLPEEENDTE